MSNERDDELLRRHLLGQLTDEESARLEERLLAEGDLFELAEAVEADLAADGAAREALPAAGSAARDRLARLAASPRGRRAAALARGLAAVAAERSAGDAPVLRFRAARPAAPAPRPLRRLALAAGLGAALLATALLVLDRGAGPGEERPLRAAREAPEGRPAPRPQTDLRRIERGQRGPGGGQVAELPAAPPAAPPGREAAAPAPPARPVEATLLLSLATLRSESAVPRLVLPAGVESVRLAIDLGVAAGEPIEYTTYAATLHDAAGGKVWSGEGLVPDRDGVLRLAVPAAALPAGGYELAVSGFGAGGTLEDLGFPQFEVVRP